MNLDIRTIALIGIGASITANCERCLETHVSLARGSRVDEQEIVDAIALGQMIRKGIAKKMDKFAANMNSAVHVARGSQASACCG